MSGDESTSPLRLFGHPFSSYTQEALIAFYENDVPFEFVQLDQDGSPVMHEFEERWPLKRFPILVEGDRTVLEATIVIEYLALYRPGPVRLIPDDPAAALDVRMLDRFFDNYVSTPLQTIVFDAIRPAGAHDDQGVAEARTKLDQAYRWLDRHLVDRTWAAGDAFGLADCSAAPALFYADWVQRIDPSCTRVQDYRRRLLARPSFARAVDEARPYRSYFPLGAPDRD